MARALGILKPRHRAINRGEPFFPVRAKEVHGNPTLSKFFIFQPSKGKQPQYHNRASNTSLYDSYELCSCVSVCARVYDIPGSNSNRKNLEVQRQLIFYCVICSSRCAPVLPCWKLQLCRLLDYYHARYNSSISSTALLYVGMLS